MEKPRNVLGFYCCVKEALCVHVAFLTYVWFKEKHLEAAAVSGWLDVRGVFLVVLSFWSVKSILADSSC